MVLRPATTATTDTTLTHARLTDITALTGSLAAYSLAPARGMAGDARGVGAAGDVVGATVAGVMAAVVGATVAATMADAATTADAVTADAVTADAVTVAASVVASAEGFMVVEASTVV